MKLGKEVIVVFTLKQNFTNGSVLCLLVYNFCCLNCDNIQSIPKMERTQQNEQEIKKALKQKYENLKIEQFHVITQKKFYITLKNNCLYKRIKGKDFMSLANYLRPGKCSSIDKLLLENDLYFNFQIPIIEESKVFIQFVAQVIDNYDIIIR